MADGFGGLVTAMSSQLDPISTLPQVLTPLPLHITCSWYQTVLPRHWLDSIPTSAQGLLKATVALCPDAGLVHTQTAKWEPVVSLTEALAALTLSHGGAQLPQLPPRAAAVKYHPAWSPTMPLPPLQHLLGTAPPELPAVPGI